MRLESREQWEVEIRAASVTMLLWRAKWQFCVTTAYPGSTAVALVCRRERIEPWNEIVRSGCVLGAELIHRGRRWVEAGAK